ncbi:MULTISPECIES: LuxR C-terminal-related transcriptional regulator [Nocardiaceae]|uniref:helix-turn-helix transcriptional regulator n=1 Tax=Nocardiaceae TaxID=85025 RepID=UPI00195E854B|nr:MULTISPECIES: LuxR C-terminal-related transcriptional regulator [Rhodococcus]
MTTEVSVASDQRPHGELLRPRDDDVLRSELRSIAHAWSSPVTLFGGSVSSGTLVISEMLGTRTAALKNLTISPRSGLGGRAMNRCAPQWVDDYHSSSTISHEYDRPVLVEGLRSVIAVPIVVGGTSRAVLYAGLREASAIGGRTCDLLVDAGKRIGAEIVLRDEVDRRIRLLDSLGRHVPRDQSMAEGIREIYGELRPLIHSVPDGALRSSLLEMTERLAELTRPGNADSRVILSSREVDVLACVALGCSNSDVAQRLSIKTETVKSYLRTAMGKLDAHSRHEAVVQARKRGLLP